MPYNLVYKRESHKRSKFSREW